jgi:hypothetical protein
MKNSPLAVTFMLLFILPVTLVSAQARKKAEQATREWRYELQCSGVGVDGTKLVKVFSYSKKADVAIEQAKKNAVHGMIFKGYAGNSATRCPSAPPLSNNPAVEKEKAEYFESFFDDGGPYMKFVAVSGDGSIAPGDRVKVGKEYKVGIVVSVMYDQLRKELENAGIIKGLSSGF